MEYISHSRPVRKVTCVEKTGWYGGSYVLNGEVIGGEAGSVIFQAARSSKNDFRVSGDTREWMRHVGRYCVGNSRLAFCVSLAFAAPLLTLLGMGGGGYHLKGESTDGKTTTMKVAASVCGGPDYWKTWRATGNALEGIALRRNDAVLMLDEISEVDGREASRIAYMLGNGQGKARREWTEARANRRNGRFCFSLLARSPLPNMQPRRANVAQVPGLGSGWCRSPAIPASSVPLRSCTVSAGVRPSLSTLSRRAGNIMVRYSVTGCAG
ncbi:DNA primase [Klebsiella quasipneumoniae]|nr:DNA primase [Klebsiella quasipneumoniae]